MTLAEPARWMLAWAVVMLAVGAVACGSSDDGGASGDDDTVSIALGSDPASLDPAKVINQADAVVTRGLYDTLVRTNPDGEVVAGLAESWEVGPKSVTFTMRDDVTCADKTKLTPTAVADSLTRLADPKTASQGAGITFGGRPMKARADDRKGTLTVSVATPWSELLTGLSMPWTGIVCPAGLKDPKQLDTKAFGTGPYELESVARGRTIVLTQRNGYKWAPDVGELGDGGAPATVTFRIVPNESTAANLMVSGKLDAAMLLGPEVERLRGAGDFSVEEKAAGTNWLAFNEAPGKPMADEARRKAIAATIDRQAFFGAANDGRGELVPTVVAPSVPCFDADAESVLPKHDPNAAKAQLEGKLPKLTIIGTTQLAGGAGTEYIQAALKKAGIQASLENSDTTTWSTRVFGGQSDWDLTVMPVLNPADSMFAPVALLVGEAPPKGTNVGSIQNPAFLKAFTEATSGAGDDNCAAWKEAQRALVSRTDVLPLSTLPISVVLRNGLSGLAPQGGLLDVGTLRLG